MMMGRGGYPLGEIPAYLGMDGSFSIAAASLTALGAWIAILVALLVNLLPQRDLCGGVGRSLTREGEGAAR